MTFSKLLKPKTIVVALTIVLASNLSFAQQSNTRIDVSVSLDESTKAIAIEQLKSVMSKIYVFPEIAIRVNKMLDHNLKRGEYLSIKDGKEFAKTLTMQLQQETKDKHLSVQYEETLIPQPDQNAEQSKEDLEREELEETTFMRAVNFGIERIERLPGNVGYFDFRGFGRTELVGPTISAAMQVLHASDALIIDLRKNGGGSPDTVAFLASFFIPAQTHLNDIYNREKNTITQKWSLPYTPTPCYDSKKKVYILTSSKTFSAAEDFAYTLQSLKRSTTIGEVTGGGAHPVTPARLSEHLIAMIPFGRSISPITKTNWEGTGVHPEIKVDEIQALKTAHLEAVQDLLTKEIHPGKRRDLERALEELRK